MTDGVAEHRTTTTTTTIVDMQLDRDADDAQSHPRRLLRLPITGELLSWGGDTGAIRVQTHKNEEGGSVEIRRWDDDDDVRAVAVSHDGTRVALGFDSGSTLLYTYAIDDIRAAAPHPFVAAVPRPSSVVQNACAVGPTFAASIRDLAFDPRSADVLAVATEEGLCVIDVSRQGHQERYLQDEAAQHHDGGGVRGIAFAPSGRTLASLAMDGRLCLWDTSDSHTPAAWKWRHREAGRCVTRRDVGELLGADAGDRSCRPHFLTDATLAVPGETYLQLRSLPAAAAAAPLSFDQALSTEHIETIVAMASSGMHLVSAGRDHRVILWSIVHQVRSKRSVQ